MLILAALDYSTHTHTHSAERSAMSVCAVLLSGPQLLSYVYVIVLLQVLEEISCYPDNTDFKELRRILTQPHFMVS